MAPARAIVWMDPAQLPLVREVAARVPLSIAGVGSSLAGHAVGLAKELGGQPLDDLRGALARLEADVVFLASAGDFGAREAERTALVELADGGARVLTLEPMPASAFELLGHGWFDADAIGLGAHPCDRVRLVPSIAECTGVRGLVNAFGTPRTMHVETSSGRAMGTLGARVYGAIELVTSVMGEPETVDCAYAGPVASVGVHAMAGDTLRDLRGEMTLNLRFADGRAAGIVASDRVHVWRHAITLLGDQGRLRADERGMEWIGTDGRVVEASEHDTEPGGAIARAGADVARGIGADFRSGGVPTPRDHAMVLCVASAALLSARTAHAESPATLRRMAGLS